MNPLSLPRGDRDDFPDDDIPARRPGELLDHWLTRCGLPTTEPGKRERASLLDSFERRMDRLWSDEREPGAEG